jgi:hypothetical protein
MRKLTTLIGALIVCVCWAASGAAAHTVKHHPVHVTTVKLRTISAPAQPLGFGLPASNPEFTIKVVQPKKPIRVDTTSRYLRTVVKRTIGLPSPHPVCLPCRQARVEPRTTGRKPLPAYTVPFSPAGMWAEGPLCYQSGDDCSYQDWLNASGHTTGDDVGVPSQGQANPGGQLPPVITSPSRHVVFTIPCYFVWDSTIGAQAPDDGLSSSVGDFLHCDAEVFGVDGPEAVLNESCQGGVCGVDQNAPQSPEIGSGWQLLASGSVNVGPNGVSKYGGVSLGAVACAPPRTNDSCSLWERDITLSFWAPSVTTSIVFGMHYWEGDDRGYRASDQPGFSSSGDDAPIELDGYDVQDGDVDQSTSSVLTETPTIQCNVDNYRSGQSSCGWVGVNTPQETVMCVNPHSLMFSPGLASFCANPTDDHTAVGFDMSTGPFSAQDNGPTAEGSYENGFTDLSSLFIEPTAFVQTNYLVKSIIYQPPGAGSSADYSKKTSSVVTLAAGATVSQGSTNSTSESTSVGYKLGTPSSIGGVPLTGFNFSDTQSSGWSTDETTTATSSQGTQAMWGSAVSETWGTPSKFVPSGIWSTVEPGLNYYTGDLYILALDPQWAVWDWSNNTRTSWLDSLVGVGGQASLPVASGSGPSLLGQCIGWGQQQADISLNTSSKPVILDASDCVHLLAMDPSTAGWVTTGRGGPSDVGDTVTPYVNDGRLVTLGQCCGAASPIDLNGGGPFTLQKTDELQQVQTSSFTADYSSKVTATVGNDWSAGVTLPEGLGSGTITNSDSMANGGSWDINYKDTLSNSQDTVTNAQVTLQDPNSLSTQVYLDTTFGTFTFPSVIANVAMIDSLQLLNPPSVICPAATAPKGCSPSLLAPIVPKGPTIPIVPNLNVRKR